jgi:hypothetical protein
LENANFLKVEKAARDYYATTNNNAQLGKIVSVQTQVVEGTNYMITFQTDAGKVRIVVWAIPWENSYTVQGVYKNLKVDNGKNDNDDRK